MNFSITVITKPNKKSYISKILSFNTQPDFQDNIIRETKIMISKEIAKTLNYSD